MKSNPLLLPIDRIRTGRLLFYLRRMIFSLRNVFIVLVALICSGGLLLSFFDGIPIAEGQYLAFITALTIGYGDLAPQSWPARIVAGFIGVNGLILTGVIIACTVKALELTFREDLENIEREIEGAEDDPKS